MLTNDYYDLIVIGGGTAGTLCAIAAARSGLKTAVIERNSWLGGMACGSGLTEMNAAGQKLVDTFAEPALARHLKTFVDGAALLNAHTILSKFGLGFLSDWSKGTFGGNKAVRNDFYIRFGRAAHPSITDKMTGIDANAKLSDIEKFI